jgi:hypothetical protein
MKSGVVLCGLILTAGGALAQDLCPFKQGQSREYKVARNRDPETHVKVTTLAERELDGRRVIPERTDAAGQSSYSFMVRDDTGVYELAHQERGALEPEVDPTPRYILRYPLEHRDTWEEVDKTSLLEVQAPLPVETKVERTGETVTVAAGTFRNCVRTRTYGTGRYSFGQGRQPRVWVEERDWYCPGLCLVKSVRVEYSDDTRMGPRQQVVKELAATTD